MLAANFVVGGQGEWIRFPEVTLGYAATGGITVRLTAMVGLLKAKELLMTGRWVGADEALWLGLLSEIADDPKKRLLELAGELARLPAVSLSVSKESIERCFEDMEACLRDEVNAASYCFAQSEAEQALSNFRARKAKARDDEVVAISGDSNARSNAGGPRFRNINSALRHAVQSFPDRPLIRLSGRDTSFG